MQFTPYTIRPWPGRYARIEGQTTVFHLRASDRIEIDWDLDGERLRLTALGLAELDALAEAVSEGKHFLNGASSSGRGQFVINEFGQVLVPSSAADGRRAIVGRIEGSIHFERPDGSVIDLSDDSNLETGDPWPFPYLGVAYNLHAGSRIYFWRGEREEPPIQDRELIESLRKIRTFGSARFIVNPWGLVATKKPPTRWTGDEQAWDPVYVGRIDHDRWFEIEEI